MHRKVDAGRGAGWIVDGFAHIKANGGVFATMGMITGSLGAIPFIGVLFGLLGPVFQSGFLYAFNAQRGGATVRAGQLFDGFSSRAFGQLMLLVVTAIAFAILIIVIMLIAVGPALFSMIRDGGEPQPEQILALLVPLGLAMLLVFPLAIVFSWVMFLALPRVALDEIPAFEALRDSFAAIRTNLGALLVNLVCWIALMVVLMFPVMLLSVVIGAMSAVGGFGMQMLGQFIVSALFGAVYVVIYSASMYQAWLELFAAEVTNEQDYQQPATFEA